MLPANCSGQFDWEADGLKHRYTVEITRLHYRGEIGTVYCDLKITKRTHTHLGPIGWYVRRWMVESLVRLFDEADVRKSMVVAALEVGIMPSELLLHKCLELAQNPVRPARDAVLAAHKAAFKNPRLHAA
jgi:hypothetical protein